LLSPWRPRFLDGRCHFGLVSALSMLDDAPPF
jgi:hypothetical protein